MHFSKDMKNPPSDKKNPDLDFSNLKAAVVKKILYIYNGFLTVEQWKIPEFWWAFDSVHRIKMLFLFLFFFFIQSVCSHWHKCDSFDVRPMPC